MDSLWGFVRENYLLTPVKTLNNEQRQNLIKTYPNFQFDEYIKILTNEEKVNILRNSDNFYRHENFLNTNDTIFVVKKDIIINCNNSIIDTTIKKGFYYKVNCDNIKNNWILNILYIWMYLTQYNDSYNSLIWNNNRLHQKTVESILYENQQKFPDYWYHNEKACILPKYILNKLIF